MASRIARLGATWWFLQVDHFCLRHSTRVAGTPFTALSGGGGGHTSAPHWIRAWGGSNKRVAIEK